MSILQFTGPGAAIGVAQPTQHVAALSRVFASQPQDIRSPLVEMTLAANGRGEVSFDGLFVATRDHRIVGAAWCHLAAGRIAVVWPAQVVADETRSTASNLMESLEDYISSMPVDLAQAVVTESHGPEARSLESAGFSHSADLLYLVCPSENFPSSQIETSLEFDSYTDKTAQRLVDVILKSYQGTLDCPALDGIRDIQDVLEGYKHVGSFEPGRWFIVRHDQEDVGCLLLADHPDANQWELVYMGLTPEARGNRWGLQIARHALWLANQAGRSQMLLAVDQDNQPARNAYAAAGFEICDRRSVFLRRITQIASSGLGYHRAA